MYPYYKMVTALNSGDIATVQTIYPLVQQTTPTPTPTPTPAPSPTPSPTPTPSRAPSPPSGGDATPPSLTIASPGGTSVSTTAPSIVFSGKASDNVGVAGVTWSTNTGSSGRRPAQPIGRRRFRCSRGRTP